MPKTLIKPRLHFNKNRQKPNLGLEDNQSRLPPNLQVFEQKFLSGNGFLIYNRALKILK